MELGGASSVSFEGIELLQLGERGREIPLSSWMGEDEDGSSFISLMEPCLWMGL